MARGSKPGERRGNAKGGQPLKETILRGEAAERTLAAAQASGKKLAIDVLEDFMNLFAGMTAYYQPMPNGVAPKPNQDENKFVQYARMTMKVAEALAPYQSATYRAIVTAAPPPPRNPGDLKKKFTLLVFDNARPQLVNDGKEIEGKVVKRRTK